MARVHTPMSGEPSVDPPRFVGLCPGEHLGEWYMPMDDTGPFVCPECDRPMVIYSRIPDVAAEGLRRALDARHSDDLPPMTHDKPRQLAEREAAGEDVADEYAAHDWGDIWDELPPAPDVKLPPTRPRPHTIYRDGAQVADDRELRRQLTGEDPSSDRVTGPTGHAGTVVHDDGTGWVRVQWDDGNLTWSQKRLLIFDAA